MDICVLMYKPSPLLLLLAQLKCIVGSPKSTQVTSLEYLIKRTEPVHLQGNLEPTWQVVDLEL